MSAFRPPTADIAFILEHVVDYDAVALLPGYEHADLETVSEILDEAGNFMAEVVAPTNRAGDLEGGRSRNGLSPSLQVGLGGGVRGGIGLRWSGRGAR